MMIIVVVGVFAALIVPGFFGSTCTDGGVGYARSQVKGLENDFDRFKLDCGRFPTRIDDLVSKPDDADIAGKWRGPYLKSLPVDVWGTPLAYRSPGIHNPTGYDLWSFGFDKQDGTDDDIVNWTQ